jgi:hypothetical protein
MTQLMVKRKLADRLEAIDRRDYAIFRPLHRDHFELIP